MEHLFQFLSVRSAYTRLAFSMINGQRWFASALETSAANRRSQRIVSGASNVVSRSRRMMGRRNFRIISLLIFNCFLPPLSVGAHFAVVLASFRLRRFVYRRLSINNRPQFCSASIAQKRSRAIIQDSVTRMFATGEIK